MRLRFLFRNLIRGARVDRQLDDEVRSFVDMLADDKVAQGIAPEEARRQAHIEAGGIEQLKEATRDAHTGAWLESFVRDVRYGLRMLARTPDFSAVAVLTLALGIGANTAIFSLVNVLLLRPLAYPQSGRLVHAQWRFAQGDVPSVTGTEFAFWTEHSRAFESTAAVALFPSGFNLVTGSEPAYVKALAVSRDFFRTLGVQPVLGRTFTADEDRPNTPKAVVLSYGLWQRRFASDPGIVGRTIQLDNTSYLVTGVMPKGFVFVLPYAVVQHVDAWVPLALVPDAHDQGHDFTMIARLNPGIRLEQAQSDMARVLAEIRQDIPGHVRSNEGGMWLVPYQKWVTGDIRAPLLILFAAVGLVLLIATVNVANLILTRAVVRQPEVAVRLALGASQGRVLRQLLTEHLLLAFLGGALAVIVAPVAVHALLAFAPQSLPLTAVPHVDLAVLAFAFCVSAAAGLAAGILPAMSASRSDVSNSIKQGARTLSGNSAHARLKNFMVTGEVALSVLLLSGAMLLTLSLIALERTDPGFNPRALSTFHLWIPADKFETAATTWDFERRLLARLSSVPGAESAAVVSALPLEPGLNGDATVTTGKREAHVYVEKRSASPDYFRTMQIPVVQGRAFRESDDASAGLVVIVNQTFAHLCCPGGNVLGGQVALNAGSKGTWPRQIVGVVADTREEAIAEPAPAMVFFPPAQLDDELRAVFSGSSWVIRSHAPLSAGEIQRAVAHVDNGEAVADFAPMTDIVAESLAPSRFITTLMIVFAALALLLAAIGLYGVLSYSVAERTHEIGLRMALGAERRDVRAMVLSDGFRVALPGVAVGLALALALTRLLRNLLFGVSPTNPEALLAVTLILVAVASLASYIPGWRATRVDPMTALRYE